MSRYFMSKAASFDVDDAEDERVYNRIRNDPKMDKWQKGTSDELEDQRRKMRNWGLGLGATSAAALGAGMAFPGARNITTPIALGTGITGGAMGLGALTTGALKKDYDDRKLAKKYVRAMNIDRYMRENGSRHAGRRMQRLEGKNRDLAIALALSN